jgi:hypothetical protein
MHETYESPQDNKDDQQQNGPHVAQRRATR